MADITTHIVKDIYSPFVMTIDNASVGLLSNGPYDFIKCVSDDPGDEATIVLTPIGASVATTVNLSSGDSVFGPFDAVNITGLSATADVMVHERSVVLQTFINSKPAATTGYTNASDDTFQIQGVNTELGTVSTGYLSMNVTTNSGSAGTGIINLKNINVTSISTGGLITFNGSAVFNNAFVADISYKIKLNK